MCDFSWSAISIYPRAAVKVIVMEVMFLRNCCYKTLKKLQRRFLTRILFVIVPKSVIEDAMVSQSEFEMSRIWEILSSSSVTKMITIRNLIINIIVWWLLSQLLVGNGYCCCKLFSCWRLPRANLVCFSFLICSPFLFGIGAFLIFDHILSLRVRYTFHQSHLNKIWQSIFRLLDPAFVNSPFDSLSLSHSSLSLSHKNMVFLRSGCGGWLPPLGVGRK